MGMRGPVACVRCQRCAVVLVQRSVVEHLLCAVGNPGGFATQHVVVVAIVGIVPIVIFTTLVC